MFSGHEMKPIAFTWSREIVAGEDDKVDDGRELFRMCPRRQCLPLITAHDPKKLVVGKLFVEQFRRAIGEIRLIGFYFDVIDDRLRQTGGGEFEHM